MAYKKEIKVAYLEMTDRVGKAWLDVFDGRTEFYSAPYWDLFVGLWRDGGSARKTDALKYLNTVKSALTAGKYVDAAVRAGLLLEAPNAADSRSKIVSLAPEILPSIEAFLDVAVDQTMKFNEESSIRSGCS